LSILQGSDKCKDLLQKQQKPLVDAPPQRLSDFLYRGNDHFHHAFPRFIETDKKYQHSEPSVNENEGQEKRARPTTAHWQNAFSALFVPYLWLFLRAFVLKPKSDRIYRMDRTKQKRPRLQILLILLILSTLLGVKVPKDRHV